MRPDQRDRLSGTFVSSVVLLLAGVGGQVLGDRHGLVRLLGGIVGGGAVPACKRDTADLPSISAPHLLPYSGLNYLDVVPELSVRTHHEAALTWHLGHLLVLLCLHAVQVL